MRRMIEKLMDVLRRLNDWLLDRLNVMIGLSPRSRKCPLCETMDCVEHTRDGIICHQFGGYVWLNWRGLRHYVIARLRGERIVEV